MDSLPFKNPIIDEIEYLGALVQFDIERNPLILSEIY